MYCCNAALITRRYDLVEVRRAMPQLNLNFIDIPSPETRLWEQFDDEQKRIVIETLTRLLVKLAQTNNQQEQIQKEQNND
jgi:phenylpyruvate tautomerase PptA (4-oxalocrotonate tautomerase family)